MAVVWRIRDRATFAALRSRGRRVRRGPLTVVWLDEGPAGSPPRVGYAVGRAVGSAVVRNRLRRRLRVAATEAGLPAGAWQLIAAPAAADRTVEELRELLRAAAAELAGARA